MVQVEELVETAIVGQEIEEEAGMTIPDTFSDLLQCVSEGTSGSPWEGVIDGIVAYCIHCEKEARIKETLDGRDSS